MTLKGGGGEGVSKNVTGQFLLVISLVKVDKTCHMGGGGSKKCGKSVTYYLNGPKDKTCLILSFVHFLICPFGHLYSFNVIAALLRVHPSSIWQGF